MQCSVCVGSLNIILNYAIVIVVRACVFIALCNKVTSHSIYRHWILKTHTFINSHLQQITKETTHICGHTHSHTHIHAHNFAKETPGGGGGGGTD